MDPGHTLDACGTGGSDHLTFRIHTFCQHTWGCPAVEQKCEWHNLMFSLTADETGKVVQPGFRIEQPGDGGWALWSFIPEYTRTERRQRLGTERWGLVWILPLMTLPVKVCRAASATVIRGPASHKRDKAPLFPVALLRKTVMIQNWRN